MCAVHDDNVSNAYDFVKSLTETDETPVFDLFNDNNKQKQESKKQESKKGEDSDTQSEVSETTKTILASITARGQSGFSNLGNTCFMNAALQALASSDLLLAYLTHPCSDVLTHLQSRIIDDAHIKNEKNNEEKKIKNEVAFTEPELKKKVAQTLTYKLRILFKYYWAHNCEVKPTKFKKCVDKHLLGGVFAGYRQHDSQEFLSAIIDKIHEETKAEGRTEVKFDAETFELENELKQLYSALSAAKKNKDIVMIRFAMDQLDELYHNFKSQYLKIHYVWAWQETLKQAYSIIVDIYSGMEMTTTTCNSCNKLSLRFDNFAILTLPIPQEIKEDKTKYTLDELFENYTSDEQLNGTNQCICAYCEKKTDTTKKTTFYQQPTTLVLMIKKYQKYKDDIFKSNIKIDYEHEFDIAPYMSEKPIGSTKYELRTVIRHSGSTGAGHYYSYVKNAMNGLWFLCDDEDVYGVENEKDPLDANGYILVYKLKCADETDTQIEKETTETTNDTMEDVTIEDKTNITISGTEQEIIEPMTVAESVTGVSVTAEPVTSESVTVESVTVESVTVEPMADEQKTTESTTTKPKTIIQKTIQPKSIILAINDPLVNEPRVKDPVLDQFIDESPDDFGMNDNLNQLTYM